MRLQSHRQLGCYLADRYMSHLPPKYIRAFLIGCTQPDRNPATYLKGSIRAQWLRGHNYSNTHRFMERIRRRLSKKDSWNRFDFYTLGKLIHYTADAFTRAHNEDFSFGLAAHRAYEAALQEQFLPFLQQEPVPDEILSVRRYHREYCRYPADVFTDCRFALNACCCVLAGLLSPRIL